MNDVCQCSVCIILVVSALNLRGSRMWSSCGLEALESIWRQHEVSLSLWLLLTIHEALPLHGWLQAPFLVLNFGVVCVCVWCRGMLYALGGFDHVILCSYMVFSDLILNDVNWFYMSEGNLEVKLPTIWADEKQRWAEAERREEQKREDQRSERARSKKIQVREKVGKSQNTVFFQWFVAPEGRKVGSLKRRVRSHLARWEMKKCTPLRCEAHV